MVRYILADMWGILNMDYMLRYQENNFQAGFWYLGLCKTIYTAQEMHVNIQVKYHQCITTEWFTNICIHKY